MMMSFKIMKMLTLMAMLFSYMFIIFSNHPLIMGIVVILQSAIISFIMALKFKFSWFSFMIFMIYLGGILMLFSYIISITYSEEKILKKSKKMKVFFLTFVSLLPFFIQTKEESFFISMKTSIEFILSSIFSESSWKLSLFMILFLLLIMIFVVFMTETKKSSSTK
uniref:NADH dehydrogenase subunit 6 n=1 Tax=Scirtothrips dorsalis TaxID=163899 RepID=A0A089N706_SCIDO|nr:NADH dehydrogenase subunit 6 [Scirtothrips dorsalis]AIQ81006.1 NADH dehydrogenase subunit 6 [Scirtothrips dorsalis]